MTINPEHIARHPELHALVLLVQNFSENMKTLLVKHYENGKRGWDDISYYDYMQKELEQCVKEGRWINVANYAAFLWNLEQ